MSMEREYKALATEIVIQAAEDYFNALYWLKTHKDREPDDKEVRHRTAMKIDCELFFRSNWCKQLTEIDGNRIIKAIRERVKDAKLNRFELHS